MAQCPHFPWTVPMSPVLWSVMVVERFVFVFLNFFVSVFSFSRNIIHYTLCQSTGCAAHNNLSTREKVSGNCLLLVVARAVAFAIAIAVTAPPPIPTILTTSPSSSSSSHHSMHIAFFSVGYSFSGKVLVGI